MIDEISGDLLQWLRGFYFVALKGSLRHASIAMGREQATISRQILCLEKELGTTLFDRSSGKMVITHEGKILQEYAEAIFDELKHMKDEFKKEESNYRGNIYVAATPAIIHNILPPYVDSFQKLHPKVTFKFDGFHPAMVYKKVESSEVDFGIAESTTGSKTLICQDLFEASVVMIVPKNHPYFTEKAIPTLKQIANAPFILAAYEGLSETMVLSRFAKSRLKPNIVMAHNNFITIKKYVAHGMGVAILSGAAISQEDEQNLTIYNLDRYFPKRRYGILMKEKKYLSAMVKAFIHTIKPDIDFSANLESSETAPILSLPEFLHKQIV